MRYLSGDRKINAIKLVRELTRCGLKEAKDLVEQQGVVARDLSMAEARSIAARFEQIGSRVEIVGDGGRASDVDDGGHAGEDDEDYGYDDLDF